MHNTAIRNLECRLFMKSMLHDHEVFSTPPCVSECASCNHCHCKLVSDLRRLCSDSSSCIRPCSDILKAESSSKLRDSQGARGIAHP